MEIFKKIFPNFSKNGNITANVSDKLLIVIGKIVWK